MRLRRYCASMRWIVILVLTVVAVVCDTTLAASSASPRCALAVMAVVLARWPIAASLLVVATLQGIIADAIDPGSTAFHAVFALTMAALVVILGERLRGHGILATMIIAGVTVLLQAVILALLVNPAGWEIHRIALRLLFTVAMAGILDQVLYRLFREPPRYMSPL
ncbi:MAG: hypothetical protein EA401_03770 [Planctomycetota bacterium]|nr:MAG: hypothetical protein EA401_03770 [Planctomycetota bacterium]